MKVLHLCGGGDVGGAKTHILSLVKELSKYIDVKIISFRPGPFADDAQAMGIDVSVVNTGNVFGDAKKVISIIKDEGYQLIHSHGAKANMFAAITRSFVKLPVASTVHSDYRLDYMQSALKKYTYGIINIISLRFIDYYIAVSNNFKQMLTKRRFPTDRIFTVYNGIDFDTHIPHYPRDEFSKKYNISLNDDDVLVGILARLDPVKGLSVFVQAAREVLQKNPNVKFLIGGEGQERKSLERKVESFGIKENVLFLGWVDNPHEFMSNVDINVLTSISESFPYVILEGVRHKNATVSSNIGGVSDLIESGENGFLFDSGNYRKLAEYLLLLVNNKALRLEMGEKIYDKARRHFSLEAMCKTQLDIYNNIMANEEKLRAKE